MTAKEMKKIKGTVKQKMSRRNSKDRGNHQEQEINKQKTTEGIDGGLHPAEDEQSLAEG